MRATLKNSVLARSVTLPAPSERLGDHDACNYGRCANQRSSNCGRHN